MWPFDGVEGRQEWSRQCWFKDPNYGGSPLKREEEHGQSIMSHLYVKMVKYGDDIWTPILMASYWLQVVTRPPILPRDNAWLFPDGNVSQSVGVIARFTWKFLLGAIKFGVPMLLLTMIFWAEPKYFPWLRKSGTYVLKYYKCLN